MKLKRFLRSYSKVTKPICGGFSLVELLVVLGLSSVISVMILTAILSQKKLHHANVVRTQSNQDLRGVLDLLNTEIRLGGENLPAEFPALLLTDGSGGSADTLTIRRNLLDEVLKLCTSIVAGTTARDVYFSYDSSVTSPVPSNCGYNVNSQNYSSWESYWTEQGSGTLRALIYNSSSQDLEFFDFVSVLDSGTQYKLYKVSNVNWANNYDANNGWVYFLEEWQLSLNGEVLQLINANDTANPLNLAQNISNFQVVVNLQDDTSQTSFSASDDWTAIKNIEVTVTAKGENAGKTVYRDWTAKYFPRNIISTYG